MAHSESLRSSCSTMIPQPVHKRTRNTIITYVVVGITFLVISVSILGIVYLSRSQSNEFPNSLKHIAIRNLKPDKFRSIAYKEQFTASETQMIIQLRNATQEHFTKSYMGTDGYLVKWLRECDWNFNEAKEMLLQHFEWRKEKDIDNILQEDFSYWEDEFPYYTDGVDFVGRPVVAADVSLWDVRKVVTSGRSDELLRYGHYQMEKGVQGILKAQNEGKNVTQAIMVANLDQFNMAQHACLKCIPVLVEYLFDAADHYPGWLYRIILVNTPETFEMILSLAAPATRGENKDAIMIFGTNKREWEDIVFNLIPRDQLRPRFGGSKVMDGDHPDQDPANIH